MSGLSIIKFELQIVNTDTVFVTVTSTAGARELSGLFRERPWKDKNRAGVSCPLSQLPFSNELTVENRCLWLCIGPVDIGYYKIFTEDEKGK